MPRECLITELRFYCFSACGSLRPCISCRVGGTPVQGLQLNSLSLWAVLPWWPTALIAGHARSFWVTCSALPGASYSFWDSSLSRTLLSFTWAQLERKKTHGPLGCLPEGESIAQQRLIVPRLKGWLCHFLAMKHREVLIFLGLSFSLQKNKTKQKNGSGE